MGIIEENEGLIADFREAITQLKVSEMESMFENGQMEDDNYSKAILEGRYKLLRLQTRVCAVNEKIITEQQKVKDRLQNINYLDSFPYGIAYMDSAYNSINYWVASFYNELYIKYQDNPTLFLIMGLMKYNSNGRILNVNALDESDKKKAMILDYYINLCKIKMQMEMMIDCIKCIQYNYV